MAWIKKLQRKKKQFIVFWMFEIWRKLFQQTNQKTEFKNFNLSTFNMTKLVHSLVPISSIHNHVTWCFISLCQNHDEYQNFSYAHLIFVIFPTNYLFFSPLLGVLLSHCRQQQKLLFLHNFALVVTCESALEPLLCIAVNYYICNFKYTIWGLNPWNSNLLFFPFFRKTFSRTFFFQPANKRNENCCWRKAIRSFIRLRVVFLSFSFRFFFCHQRNLLRLLDCQQV